MISRSSLLRLWKRGPPAGVPVPPLQIRRRLAAITIRTLPGRLLHLTARRYATIQPSSSSSPAQTVPSVPQAEERPPAEPVTMQAKPPSPPEHLDEHHQHHEDTQVPKCTHQFDTYRVVLALQAAGYSRPQAVALMKCLRTLLGDGHDFAKLSYLSRGDLENETYLFRAAMSELRTEVKTIRHNEALAERAEVIALQKELDALNQQTKEDLENLRNDVTIEMNNRKIASRAEQQAMEVKIQDLNYGFTKRLADMRTEAEAQKWQTTRLLIVTLVTMIITGLGVTRYLLYRQHAVEVANEGTQTDSGRRSHRPDTPTSSELVTLG